MDGRQARVPVELGQPPELDVGVHRLQPEQQRQGDRGRGGGDPGPAGRRQGSTPTAGPTLTDQGGGPRHQCQRRDQAPRPQRDPPAARRRGQGSGQQRAGGAPERQPGPVDGHEQDAVVGGVPLDPGRCQHVAQTHPAQRHGGQDEEDRDGVGEDPRQQAGGDDHDGQEDARGDPDAAGQPDREQAHHTEPQPRHGREQAGGAARHAQPGAQLLHDGAQGGRAGAQVDRQQDDGDDGQPGGSHIPEPTGVRRFRGRAAHP